VAFTGVRLRDSVDMLVDVARYGVDFG